MSQKSILTDNLEQSAIDWFGGEAPPGGFKESGFTRWGRNSEGKPNKGFSACFSPDKKALHCQDFPGNRKITFRRKDLNFKNSKKKLLESSRLIKSF